MAKRTDYPYWNYPSARNFKAKKRKDVRVFKRAVEELRLGCAFLPACGDEMQAIFKALESLQRKCSEKEWGR